MSLVLHRIDDRLIHGQVVVGWGQPLDVGFIVLVDDTVAESDWEQELYRMAVPPEVEVYFETAQSVVGRSAGFQADPRPGVLLTGDIQTMLQLVRARVVRAVNIGGVHHRAGRTQRLRYVFLAPDEEELLREMEREGATVTAQDVPSTRPMPLSEVLDSEGVY
ncbi:MAG: hypothetical protein JWO05_2357 [Gemmatimonadetes bacterium]|nr:hypothetical protein [Gemmatimonadota bacterium]